MWCGQWAQVQVQVPKKAVAAAGTDVPSPTGSSSSPTRNDKPAVSPALLTSQAGELPGAWRQAAFGVLVAAQLDKCGAQGDADANNDALAAASHGSPDRIKATPHKSLTPQVRACRAVTVHTFVPAVQ